MSHFQVTKEILKLYSKKNSLDVSIGEVRKKDKKKERDTADSMANFENTFGKFRKLSFFDQHAVTQSCATQVAILEQLLVLPVVQQI